MIQKKQKLFQPLFYFLLVVLLFLVLVDLLFLMKQYSVLIGSEKKNMQEELMLMGTLMREALLKNDYATVENFVQSWGETHENVTDIRAVAKNGFPISEFRRKAEDHEIVRISLKVDYSEGKFITLHLSKSLQSIQERFRSLILNIGALSLGLTMLMAALLWFTIKKTAIRPMQGMLEEIKSFNEQLEQRVAERTEALKRANEELETEISERREAEEEIRIKANLLESSSDAILLLDLDANFIYFNSALMRMSGYTKEELLARKLADIEPPVFAERIKPDIAMLMNRGEAVYESAFLRKDSSTVPVEVHALLTESSGRKVIMCSVRDISERRQAEKDREQLEERLIQSQKMEAIGRLAGGIAHDFNNMLAVILGYAEMNREQLREGDPLLRNLRMIEKAAEHSRDITRQLLAFSRKQISEPKIIDLNDSFAQIEKTLGHLIGEDIELRFYPEKGLWRVKIDPSQIDQILMNLSANARDAMPKGGRLTVQTSNVQLDETYTRGHPGTKSDEYVLLEVSDEGAGMDKETQSHIFEPFFTTKETGKGTGLGLAMVYGIVHQNQGFINVYSEPGHGTVFKIYLPRVEKGDEVQAVPEAGPAYRGSGTILLVEDDAMVREMVATMLAKIGFTVLKSETSCEALSLAENKDNSIDLLLTDVIMPGMSGKELYEKIETVRRGTKVLFMSGYASEVIAQSGILETGMHFIQKPFNEKQLTQKICETLSCKTMSSTPSEGTEHA